MTNFSLVFLVLAVGASAGALDSFTVQYNNQYCEHDIAPSSGIGGVSLEACAQACLGTSSCRTFSYRNNGAGGITCYGHSVCGKRRPHAEYTVYELLSSAVNSFTLAQDGYYCTENTYPSPHFGGSLQQCAQACLDNSNCKTFSFHDDGSETTCYGDSTCGTAVSQPNYKVYELPSGGECTQGGGGPYTPCGTSAKVHLLGKGKERR
eukprot:TRINITY_DN9836_c0_g1_i2.p1 TRINITY_DN9836_c0_g1~~TRINITY_DN9836_c0_g1_i2.p1  ORF type:complete len:207 (-),score=10.96 TRINITY_DN9836_c0_g1_i2:88-708(-)